MLGSNRGADAESARPYSRPCPYSANGETDNYRGRAIRVGFHASGIDWETFRQGAQGLCSRMAPMSEQPKDFQALAAWSRAGGGPCSQAS